MILLSLLTDAYMPSQRYAIDGAILIKSVEENTQEGQGLVLLCNVNKR